MAFVEAINNKITWGIIWGWVITLPIYGFQVVLFLFIFLCLLQLVDTITGYISARKLKIITSKIGTDWLIKKSLIFLLLTILLIWVWGLKSTWLVTSDILWIIPIVFISWFCYMECISILENVSVIFWESRQWKLFKILANLSNYLFNASIDKVKEVTEKKINDKFNNNK